MATISLRISDELKAQMDRFDEVNWSSITRKMIEERVKEFIIKERFEKGRQQVKEGKVYTHEEVKKMLAEKWN